MKLGDKVTRWPETIRDPLAEKGKPRTSMCGNVVYIHPQGRYHTVEFELPGGRVRESFLGVKD